MALAFSSLPLMMRITFLFPGSHAIIALVFIDYTLRSHSIIFSVFRVVERRFALSGLTYAYSGAHGDISLFQRLAASFICGHIGRRRAMTRQHVILQALLIDYYLPHL